MPTATAKKPATRRTKAAKKPSANAALLRDVPVVSMEIPTAAISPSPFQPRQEFPQKAIEQLGESIAEQGLIHPICVRPDADGYQLVDGERRLRACQWLGRPTIRAEVGDFTDAQVMRIVVASALQRADLNPIEQALAFKRAIEAGVAAGPTELARQLGVSQGHVSNRIRLLELPDDWKARVISGEIPPTHARCLVKYRDCPAILEEVAEAVFTDEWDEIYQCRCTVDRFSESLEAIANSQTRPLTGKWKSQATHWKDVPLFAATEEQFTELKPIEVETRDGKPEQRATNVDLWDKLQAEYLAAREVKAEKRAEKAAAKQTPAKQLSAAEKKQLAAEEKRKAKQREEQFQRRLAEWYWDWLCYLVGSRLRKESSMQELLVIACYFADMGRDYKRADMTQALIDACKNLAPDVEVPKRGLCGSMQLLTRLGEMEIEAVLGRVLAEWFWTSEDGPSREVDREDLELLATYLGIVRPAEWREDQAGPLSEAYWTLHSKDQLVAMAAELGVEVDASAKKSDLVAAFMTRNDLEVEHLALPKELADITRPK
jgi:ParB family chromosome partitioning protein